MEREVAVPALLPSDEEKALHAVTASHLVNRLHVCDADSKLKDVVDDWYSYYAAYCTSRDKWTDMQKAVLARYNKFRAQAWSGWGSGVLQRIDSDMLQTILPPYFAEQRRLIREVEHELSSLPPSPTEASEAEAYTRSVMEYVVRCEHLYTDAAAFREFLTPDQNASLAEASSASEASFGSSGGGDDEMIRLNELFAWWAVKLVHARGDSIVSSNGLIRFDAIRNVCVFETEEAEAVSDVNQ